MTYRKQRGRLRYSEKKAQELADKLEQSIKTGYYKPGNPLPATNAIMQIYGIGQHTVTRSREILVDRNLVLVRPGLGTFVK